jgi:hypothetical protein
VSSHCRFGAGRGGDIAVGAAGAVGTDVRAVNSDMLTLKYLDRLRISKVN